MCSCGEAVAALLCLQVWLLKGKSDDMYRDMWVAAMDEMIARLVQYSKPSGLAYVAEMDS